MKTKMLWLAIGLLSIAVFRLAYKPATVYSFSPQIFPTGIEVDESVNSAGTGLKHVRGNGTCQALIDHHSCELTLNWPGAGFPDTNYTAVCMLEDTGNEGVMTIFNKATTSISVKINVGVSFSVHMGMECIGMHD
jgi:hypothetical protein